MRVIASRSKFRQLTGLLAYAAVSPMLLLLASCIGLVLGFTLGPHFGFDPERAAGIAAYGSAAICGPLFILATAREAFARLFSQVRFEPDRLEFDRLGTTHSWPLGQLRALRMTSQSTNVHHVTVTEVAVCLLGPDGRRLHLTDLKSDIGAELVGAVSTRMAEAMALRLEREPLRFGPTLAGQLNIYSLGPPLLWTPLLAAANLAWLSLLLTLCYFGHMAWKMRRTSIIVTSTGLRNLRGEEVAWSEVKSARAGLDEVVIECGAGTWKVTGPDNLAPLSLLVNRKAGARATDSSETPAP